MRTQNYTRTWYLENSKEVNEALERIQKRIPKCEIKRNNKDEVTFIAPSHTFLYIERIIAPFV